ncbi:DUF6471 domain-containing protein [Ideonella azotifigens]|uniref:DUF6471 domain-containing protein n=1 Tax=Ideonella azotifigens TaxID=513160 RepID=A0ABP3VBV0_9BURK|nr:DUF6471 domain-containing protein [Ideonella azotifigens]MCD2343775.1 DUF6471 domain-containing protein [Ideonella azotifigens]
MALPEAPDDARGRATTGRAEDELAEEAKRILRAEMVRRGYSFQRLVQAMEAQADGSPVESVRVLTNKVNRGRFSFAFFLRAIAAMGVEMKLDASTAFRERDR